MELCFLMGVGAAGDDNPPRYRRGDHGLSAIAMQAYTSWKCGTVAWGGRALLAPTARWMVAPVERVLCRHFDTVKPRHIMCEVIK